MIKTNHTRLLAAAVLCIAGPASAAPPDTNKFTAEMAARIAKAAPRLQVRVDGPLTLKVKGGAGAEAQINLDRVAAFCAENSAQDCEAIKVRFIAGAVEMAANDHAVTRARLRVIVRPSDYAQAIQATIGQDGRKLVVRPVGDGLVALLACDFPNTLSLVTSKDLPALHLREAEAFALGRRNVLEHLPKLPTAAELSRRVIMFAGEDYDASLLLADGWGKLAHETGGKLFVTVSSDNQLVAGVADAEQIGRLRDIAAEGFRTAERGISPDVFRWSEQGWIAVR